MLLDKGLCLPSNFSHEGFSFTWTAPNSSIHRGDFVAIPCAWFPSVVRSFKPQDFDNLLGADDHSPVALHLRDSFVGCRQEVRYAWPRPSPLSLADPDKVRYFSLLLQQFDTPSFCTPVDIHYKQIVEYYHWAASKAFPGKRSGCRTQCHSDVTWSTLMLRKKVMATYKTFYQQLLHADPESVKSLKSIIGLLMDAAHVVGDIGPHAPRIAHIASMLHMPLLDPDWAKGIDLRPLLKEARKLLLGTIAISARNDKTLSSNRKPHIPSTSRPPPPTSGKQCTLSSSSAGAR